MLSYCIFVAFDYRKSELSLRYC